MLFFLTFVFNLYEFSGMMMKYPAFIFLDMGIPFIIGPLIWTYVLALVKSPKRKANYFIHYVPALLIYFLFIDIVFMAPDEKIKLLQTPASEVSIRYQAATILQLLPVPVYLILSIVEIDRYGKKLKRLYSATEKINHRWLKVILSLFLIFWICVSAGIVTINFFNETLLGMSVFMIGLIMFSSITGIYGLKRNFLIGKLIEMPATNGYMDIVEDVNVMAYVNDNKPYLQPELTLYQLAAYMDMPAHKLSRILKTKYDTSFFDFINNQRIREFKQRIRKHEHLKFSILSIAYDCGFNSKSAFYRFFKKYEGCTPKDYISMVEAENQNH